MSKELDMLSEKSSKKISILSFILFMGVMSIHTYNLEVYGISKGKDIVLAVLETFIYDFANGTCVSYFFAISGFLFFRNFDLTLLLQKYKSRGRSIVLPYIVWNTVYYLYYVCVTRVPMIAEMMNDSKKMPIGIFSYVQYVWNGYFTLWFLRELIWLILLAPLWYLLLKRRKYYWSEWTLVLLILISLHIVPVQISGLNIYYILGAYLGMNYKMIADKCEKKYLTVLFGRKKRNLVVIAAVFLPVLIIAGGKYAGRLWYDCLLFLTIWLAMDLFSFSHDIPWWIRCTFFYYCGHDMILEAVEKIILILGGRNIVMAWADYILAPVITLLILIFAAWVLQRWLPLVWKVLSGGRGGKAYRR